MIVEVHDLDILYRITSTVNLDDGIHFGNPGYTGDQLFKYIFDKKADDLIAVYVSFNKKKINGFIILSVVEGCLDKKKQLFFNLCWIDPKAGFNVGNELIKVAHKYARSLGIKELNAYSREVQKLGVGAMDLKKNLHLI